MESLRFGYEMEPSLRAIIVDKANSPKDGVKIRGFADGCANITMNVKRVKPTRCYTVVYWTL